MFNSSLKLLNFGKSTFRWYSSKSNVKVTVVGAAGRIGQALCLLLKQSPLVDELCLHDIEPTNGLAMELNQIDTKCTVTSFYGDQLSQALQGSKIVVLVASNKNSYTLQSKELLEVNTPIIENFIKEFCKSSPRAFLAVRTNPLNSTIPMACELMKKCGCYNPNTIFGVTAVDIVRANTFTAHIQGLEPERVTVPVIGGHSEMTMIPVLSQATPCKEFTNEDFEKLTKNIRSSYQNMLKLCRPPTVPHLTEGFAIARFVISLVKAIRGETNVIEIAFVPSKVHPYLNYLATPIALGPTGVKQNLGIPPLNEYEKCLFDNAVEYLIEDVYMGESMVGVSHKPCKMCDPAPKPTVKCSSDHCKKS